MSRACQGPGMVRALRCLPLATLAWQVVLPAYATADPDFERIDRLAQAMLRHDGVSRDYLLAALREQFSFSCDQAGTDAEISCEIQNPGLVQRFSYTKRPFSNLNGKPLLFRLEFSLSANCHASLPRAWGELAQRWHAQAAVGVHGVEASRELVQSTGRRRVMLSGAFRQRAECPEQLGMETLFLSVLAEGRGGR